MTHDVQDFLATKQDFAIGGMTCAGCAARVEKALGSVPGVTRAAVNLATERARVEVGSHIDPAALVAAVARAGYDATVLDKDAGTDRSADPQRKISPETITALAAVLLSAPLLLPMLGMPLPIWFQLTLATLVQFGIGARFYAGAFKALRAGSANMDVLVALGTSAAYFDSLYELAADRGGHLYFEAAAVVIALVVIGKWMEARAKRMTTAALRALAALRPDTARVEREGAVVEVALRDVALGDVVQVRPGERLPVDGVVVAGMSDVDESLVTGESLPVTKAAGATVTGGSMNGAGLLRIETSAIGTDTLLSRVIALVEEAQAEKAPVQRLVDRVASVFVPIVLAIALVTLAGWWLAVGDFFRAIIPAVSVLVIACPCALGLATPTALMVGTGAAARAGILISDPATLEQARNLDTIVFDKTGTLTVGRPTVTEIIPHDIAETEFLTLAAAAQGGSEHPLARAIRDKAAGLTLPSLDAFQAEPGLGLFATVAGRRLVIGNARLMQANSIAPDSLADEAARLEALGHTVMWVAALDPSPVLLGVIGAADAPKRSAKAAVERLRAAGIAALLLSGDTARTTEAIAAEFGIDRAQGALLPADKAAAVRALRASGRHVGMVGDGINDAPALAAADVGFAMGSGTDVAMQAAGITLMRGDPGLVADAIAISRATSAKIRQGLFWAFVYNLIGLPLAAFGLLSPMLAGAAMALSSVSVVGNALLLRRWRPEV